MKEIKYQVWHKPTRTIQVVAIIDFNNKVLDTYGIDEPIYGIPFEDVEWRQYTGLNDKSNKLIYGRDIIRINNLQRIWKYHEPEADWRVFAIEYNRYTWAFNNPNIYMPLCDYDTRTGYFFDIEIIGNIDQYPELLK